MSKSNTIKPLKIFCIPWELIGHTNGMLGLAQTLVDRGHSVTFVVDNSRRSLIGDQFNCEIVDNAYMESVNLGQFEAIYFNRFFKLCESKSWVELISNTTDAIFANIFILFSSYKRMNNKNKQMREIFKKHDPDIFIVDDFNCYRAMFETKKPWAFHFSANPLILLNDIKLPAPFSGLPLGKYDWKWLSSHLYFNILKKLPMTLANAFLSITGSPFKFSVKSPFLNIYGLPQEIDYPKSGATDSTMFRVDSFMIKEINKYNLPEIFNKSGKYQDKKIIYVSLGSYCSANVKYMKQLIEILSKSPHLFIVSKGYYHQEYELADNMWGDRYLPQKQIIEVVDLVITHGGNNTVTESLTLGKPMIVMPFYLDQFDNAQRIHETGYGIRIDPSSLNTDTLLNAIEKLLNDNNLKSRLSELSSRIWHENRLNKAAELIEGLHLGHKPSK